MSESETYDLLSRTSPIEEHVERLHAIWGDDHGQIRHHLYRAVYSDVKWESTSDDPEHEAHTAALLAISIATVILQGISAPKPGSLIGQGGVLLVDGRTVPAETTVVSDHDDAEGVSDET